MADAKEREARHDCEEWIDEGVCCAVCQPFARQAAAASWDKAWGVPLRSPYRQPRNNVQRRKAAYERGRKDGRAALVEEIVKRVENLPAIARIDLKDDGQRVDAVLRDAVLDTIRGVAAGEEG